MTGASAQRMSYARILKLAWPASIAAAVTPVLGIVDVWALAQSARPLDIAAVGLGSVIFSLAYWTFGFIRMSVAGLTAQAAGAEDETETRATLARGAALGGLIGAALVILQIPIGAAAFHLLGLGSAASDETLVAGLQYFTIRIWGAPFALASYAAFGWLTARGRTDYLMLVSIGMTALNIILDYWFVVELGWGAAGVAAGTLIAEIAGFFFAAICIVRILKDHGGVRAHWDMTAIKAPDRLRRTLSVNFDIFVRTLLLAYSFTWFIQRSGVFGDEVLAANQVLMQLFLFTGLALDGTAIAAETLVGQAIGSRDRARGLADYKTAVRRTFILAGIAAVGFTLFYAIAGKDLIALLTPPGALRDATMTALPWVVISPLIVVIGFQLDGIFIGATRAREMRNSMIISVVIFIPLSHHLMARFDNHGLWAAFSAYFLLRAASLAIFLPRIQHSFSPPAIRR